MIKKDSKLKNLVVSLEISSSKIISLIGEILVDNTINIIGIGRCKSNGIDKGNIVDLESVTNSIKNSINQAELMSDYKISSVYLSISGKDINFQNETGLITLNENSDITQNDINNVIKNASLVKLKDHHKIIHIIPQEYIIDKKYGIINPIGLSGIKLKVIANLITCSNDTIKNLVRIVERCNIKVDKLIYSGLSSSYSVLTNDEKKLGVCLIDMGGETIDIIIYIDGILRLIKVIPYAGNLVTNDISYAFNISSSYADLLKFKYGTLSELSSNNDDTVNIPNFNDLNIKKSIKKKELYKVIKSRYIELFNLINNEIINLQNKLIRGKYKYFLSAGIVITGGSSKIDGILSCAYKIFKKEVRIGYPQNIVGLTDYVQLPDYSTSVGLLHYGKLCNNLNKPDYSNSITKILIKKCEKFLKKII
ncbi:cell division protein ftsA [endosymbiont of Sipalinus gigas]|uniref:cell division protein FtsA n=1 Tax=endosymbiont of Sipalinus gigas TaxID=1972134 RepID=UPI000DC706BC|nr:cell division protein FtsA [endosymbiont of Sipalinus gigas]BBA85181.1 cell division protein ftsA [endosymbiont of Sipalinus gigas]